MRISWTESDVVDTVIPILQRHKRGDKAGAFAAIEAALCIDGLTDAQLRGAFARWKKGNYAQYMGRGVGPGVAKAQNVGTYRNGPTVRNTRPEPEEQELDLDVQFVDPFGGAGDTEPAPPPDDEDVAGPTLLARDPLVRKLVELTKRGPVAFADLCDKLDVSPKKCRQLVDRAQRAGVMIDVAHEHVQFRATEPSTKVQDIGVAPTVGERQHVAVITDTHLGSKYCLRPQLRDFIETAYERGIREVLHVGDVIDGKYRHGLFELTHSGIEDQTRDLFEVLPHKPGLSYHGVSGNHCDTFADDVGMAPGDYMSWYFREHGRNDLHFYGRRGAYLKVRGAVVELWHPRKSAGYSLSYQLQNHIRDYGVGQKPDILLAGHWHTFCYLEQRGVHALACGTFQGGGSAFSKSLGGAPSIGGTIISWELTKTRTLRRVAVERHSYYEREEVRELVLA